MKRTCRNFAAIVAAAVLFPAAILVAQMDTNANSGAGAYPQAGSGMSQPNGPNQSTQPSMAGTNSSQRNLPTMRDSLGAPGETGQQMLDKQFVRTAAEGDIAAVQLGKLATVKGTDAVKDLAQKMVDDHTAMSKDMEALADSLGVMMPKKMNKDAQKEYDTLNGLSGKDFDTEYVTYTAKTHFAEFHSFRMEAAAAASPELAAEVVKEMGMMHEHVEIIVKVAKEQGIMLTPRPQRTVATSATK